MNQFGCVVPFIPPKSGEYDICVNKTQCEMEKIMSLFEKSASNTTQGACMIPCASMEVNFGVLFSDKDRNDGKSFIKIYLKSSVKFQQTIYDYTLLSLLAEIGGYTGLLLGVSLADITIVFEKSKQYFRL